MKQKSLPSKTFLTRAFMITLMLFVLVRSNAQTYTTVAKGNWSNPGTWMNGLVPSTTIGSGQVVNINHTVTFSGSNDLIISGALNITNDTLKFSSSWDKSVDVNTGGLLKITNGAFIQYNPSPKSDLNVNGGRIAFDNAYVVITEDFNSDNGGKRSIKNSTLKIGAGYDIKGSSSVDTIQFSNLEICFLKSGEMRIELGATLRVANAYVHVKNGKFKNDNGASISVLPGANSNIGFDFLKVSDEMKNDGNWDARIDATCVSGAINGSQAGAIDFTRSPDCSSVPLIGPAPELIFENPVLVSGQDKKQGAIYRFANVTEGVDATIKLKKFSRSDIVVQNIDLSSMGWSKAFQPQFGLSGNVAPHKNWYIDFEIRFYQAGTNTPKVLPKVDMTALDVDGDGWSIAEYASFQNPSNILYSSVNSLTEEPTSILGQSLTCSVDGLLSPLTSCLSCLGDGKTGLWNLSDCSACDATGLKHVLCNHAFEGVNASILQGPVTNCVNIDTSATQVMAVYQYTDRSSLTFRYGAKSGSNSSTAGVRLNSLWFRQFSLDPVMNIVLPVKLLDFNAKLDNKKVNLSWSTAQEKQFSHFVVQRSVDGQNFDDIGLLFTEGTSESIKNYSLVDANLENRGGLLYYRLQMVDVDKQTSYSAVRIIRLGEEKSSFTLTTYPNPAVNQLRVTIPAAWQGKEVKIELLNGSGQAVKLQKNSNASQTETINVAELGRGIYFIKATCGNESAQQRILKN